MNNQAIFVKNILSQMHHSALMAMNIDQEELYRIADFIFKNDFANILSRSIVSPHHISLRHSINMYASNAVKYNSIECIKTLYRVSNNNQSVIEKLTNALLIHASDCNNTYLIQLVVAVALHHNLDFGNTIETLSKQPNKFDIIEFIIRTCNRLDVEITPQTFDWDFICAAFMYDPEIAKLCIGLQYDRAIYMDDYLPNNDDIACKFIEMVFENLRIENQRELVDLLKYAINKDLTKCAEIIFGKLSEEERVYMTTNTIIKDDVNVLKFLHDVLKIGPEYTYLCDLCVIHISMKCLRYLIERVGLRPTQTTYNLCVRDPRSRWYSDYIKAYIQ
jgi:hypothetical protein